MLLWLKRPHLSFLEVASSSCSRVRTLQWWIEKETNNDLISNIWSCRRFANISAAAGDSGPPVPHNQKHLSRHPGRESLLRSSSAACRIFPGTFVVLQPLRADSTSGNFRVEKRTPPNNLACALLCLRGNAAAQTRSGNESTVRTSKVFRIAILPLRQ